MPRVPGIGDLKQQVRNVPAPAQRQSSFVPDFNVKASDDLATKVIAPAAKIFSDLAVKIQSDNNDIAVRKGTLAFRKEFNAFIFGESSFLNQFGENATPESLAAHRAAIGEIAGRHTEGHTGYVGKSLGASVDQTLAQHDAVLGKWGADQRTSAAKTQEIALGQDAVDGFIRATASASDADGGFSGAIEISRNYLNDLGASIQRAGEKAGIGPKAIAENIEKAVGDALTSAVTTITNSDAVDSGRRAKAFIDAFGHLTDDKVVSALKKDIRNTVETQAILDGADLILGKPEFDSLPKQLAENKRANKGAVRIGIEKRLIQAATLKEAELDRLTIERINEATQEAIAGNGPLVLRKEVRDAVMTKRGLWEHLTKMASAQKAGQAIFPTAEGNAAYYTMLELFSDNKRAFVNTDLSVPFDLAPDFVSPGGEPLREKALYEIFTPAQSSHLKTLRATIKEADIKKEAKEEADKEKFIRGKTVVTNIKHLLEAKGKMSKSVKGQIAIAVHNALEIRLAQGLPVDEDVLSKLVDASIIERENERGGGFFSDMLGAHPDVFFFEAGGEKGSIVGFKKLNVDLTFRDVVAQSTKDHLLKVQGEINATLRAEGVQGVHIDSITQIAEQLTKEGRLVASDEVMRRVQDLLADPTTRVETAGQETSPPPPKAPVPAPPPAPPAPVVVKAPVGAQPPAREPVTTPTTVTEPELFDAFTGIPVLDEAIRSLTGGAREVPQEILDALPEEFVAKEIELSDAEIIAAGKVAKLIVKREERLGVKIEPGRLEKLTEEAKQRLIETKQDISALQEADIALKRAQSRLVNEQKVKGIAKRTKLSAEEVRIKNEKQIKELKKVRQDVRRLQSGLEANITDFLTESSTERRAVDEEIAVDEEKAAPSVSLPTTERVRGGFGVKAPDDSIRDVRAPGEPLTPQEQEIAAGVEEALGERGIVVDEDKKAAIVDIITGRDVRLPTTERASGGFRATAPDDSIRDVSLPASRADREVRSIFQIIERAPVLQVEEKVTVKPQETLIKKAAKAEAERALEVEDTEDNQVISDEGGDVPISYIDSEGFLTGGIGHKIIGEDIALYPKGTPIPEATRRRWWAEDQAIAVEDVDALLTFYKITSISATTKKILTNMAFNLGRGGLKGFKGMFKAIGEKKYVRASQEMEWFNPDKHGEGRTLWRKQTKNRAIRLIARMKAQK